jgi:glycosyltransferase involved in cell wall biosynthesis
LNTRVESNSKHVLIIVENLPVPFDRRVWNEATTLIAAGYDVSIICPTGKGAKAKFEVIEGISIYRHNLPIDAKGAIGYLLEYGTALFWESWLAWKIFFKHRFDVIHACNPPDMIFLVAAPFKALFGVKFLFDHHDICPELYEAKFKRRDFFYKVMLFVERMTFRLADVSIATNNSYREIAITRGHMPPDRVIVVRSGVNLDRVKVVPANPALKKGRAFLVGYVGVMGAQEGIPYLLEAARIIVREKGRPDIQFCLVGGGPALEEMRQLSVTMGLTDYVDFTGRASDADLLEALNTADVCVNPDEANEMNDKSTMNKIMEYMALGKPVVQFDLTEGRYSAGDASLYAAKNDARDFADKILMLIDNADLRSKMGALGSKSIHESLSWSHEQPKLLAAYEAILASRPNAPTETIQTLPRRTG